MKLVKKFLTVWDAIAYCDAHPSENLVVAPAQGGVFGVWDMDAKGDG